MESSNKATENLCFLWPCHLYPQYLLSHAGTVEHLLALFDDDAVAAAVGAAQPGVGVGDLLVVDGHAPGPIQGLEGKGL